VRQDEKAKTVENLGANDWIWRGEGEEALNERTIRWLKRQEGDPKGIEQGESTWRVSVLLSVIDYDDMRRALIVEEARWTLGQRRVRGGSPSRGRSERKGVERLWWCEDSEQGPFRGVRMVQSSKQRQRGYGEIKEPHVELESDGEQKERSGEVKAWTGGQRGVGLEDCDLANWVRLVFSQSGWLGLT
jgi:hypothetical protein